MANYNEYARGRESGGNDFAKNPLSSATGRYQFIDSTWNDLAKSRPDLALTDRFNGEQQERAMNAFTAENSDGLRAAGLPTDNNSLYLAHRFGLGGAKRAFAADPTASVASIFPEVMKANPDLNGKSISDILGGVKASANTRNPPTTTGASVANYSQAPVLGAAAQLGSGVLMPAANAEQAEGGYDWRSRLTQAAAALASSSNPEQSKALLAGNAQNNNQGTFTTHIDPRTGVGVRINSKTGKVEQFKAHEAREDKEDTHVDPSALKAVGETSEKASSLGYTAQRAQYFKDALDTGKLDPSLLARGQGAIESAFGKASPQTQLYNEFQSFKTQMANDSLRLNSGVQTEGDAQRAINEFVNGFGTYDAKTTAKSLDNFINKAGRYVSGTAQQQIDSYASGYRNQKPFEVYRQGLREHQTFFNEYGKRVAPAAAYPSATTTPAAAPPKTFKTGNGTVWSYQ